MDDNWEAVPMTRSNAREIAMHINFALGFDNRSAQELLDAELTKERFQELAEELSLYDQFPNEKQERYIRELVQGVFAHGPELEAMGLGVPAMTRVFARLRSMGVDVPPSVYTIPQAREAVLAALHRKEGV